MEEIIKKLETILDELQYQESEDIYVLAVCQYLGMTLDEVRRRTNEISEQGEINVKRITDSIYNDFKEDPDSFAGLSKENKEKLFEACRDKVQNDNKKRTRTIHLLDGFIAYLKLDEQQIFLEFEKLAELFQNINIPINTQLSIVGTIVKLNSALDDTEPEGHVYLPNNEALLGYTYKYMDITELYEILKANKLDEFLEDESYPNKRAQKEVKKRFEETKLDYTDIQHACDALDAILDKDTKDVTEEDYKIIIDNMNTIHFGNLAYRFIKKIKKQIDIEDVAEAKTPEDKKISEEIKTEKKPKFSQREINHVYYEVGKYYDFDLFKPKTFMTLDKIIYILSLLYFSKDGGGGK